MPFRANNIAHLWRVWVANVRTGLIREMQFRLNFYSSLLRQLLWLASFMLLINIIFTQTNSLAGWSQGQVFTLLALSRIIEGISDALFNRNINNLPAAVNSGKFDFYLTKPLPAQFHAAFHRFRLIDCGNVLNGLVLLAYAILIEPTTHSLKAWLLFSFLAFLGIIIYYSLLITLVTLVFFLERFEAFYAISELLSEPLTVPFDIFPPGAKTVLTYLLPLAFIVFVPAQALTGRLALWQLPAAFLITAIFLAIANLAWRSGLRRYSSASS
jgi:ABC-2 type transport system permease protein